jgi:two-component system NtrC family sensor kinase
MTNRLAWRMGIALCSGAAAILVLAGAANLHLQRSQLTQLVALSADRVAVTIRGSVRDAMLRNDADALGRLVRDIGAQPGIVRVRVFNKEGRIRTSTDPAEPGRLVDMRAEQCVACHQSDRPLERLERRDRVRTFRAEDGRRVLAVIAPIPNEPQCHACHQPSRVVLGVLDVQLAMDGVDAAVLASERQMVGGLAATVGAMVLLVAGLVWAMVLKPVRRLTGAMAAAARGDLESRVPVHSEDEIGAMAGSGNALTEDLARSQAALRSLNRALEDRVEEKTSELRRTHERVLLVEKMASLGRLAAVVAHEINNPLAGIRTFARLLRRRMGEGVPAEAEEAEAARILETIDAEAGRCGDIVRNLLVFSRSAPARFAEADVRAIVERCRLLLRHQAEMLSVSLEAEAAEGLRAVCDAAQIQQMVLALAVNALEACGPGGRVTVSAGAADAGGVVIRVADTGAGIAQEARPRIFEPFFTTKEGGKGVGLGLAVVYGIVARHRGRIEVRSEPGSGSTFSVHLPPLAPGEDAARETESEASP